MTFLVVFFSCFDNLISLKVAVDSYKKNDSMSQFKLLRRMLDSHIPKAEIKRIVKHLRFAHFFYLLNE